MCVFMSLSLTDSVREAAKLEILNFVRRTYAIINFYTINFKSCRNRSEMSKKFAYILPPASFLSNAS